MACRPLKGVLLANEVLDALPVERFRMRHGQPIALGVMRAGAEFQWAEKPGPDPLLIAVGDLQRALGKPLPEGYTSEINLRQPLWLRSLFGTLGEGLVLCIDYGGTRREIYHEARPEGTLVCHYRHRQHPDPFFLPGLQDLTAWVDFSATGRAGREAGLEIEAYSTQAHTLMAAGVLQEFGGDRRVWSRPMAGTAGDSAPSIT